MQVLLGHRGLISAFALVESKRQSKVYLVSGSWDRRICIWDLGLASTARTQKVQNYFKDKCGWTDLTRALVGVFRSQPLSVDDGLFRLKDPDVVPPEELACDGYIRDMCYCAERNELAYASSDTLVYIRQFHHSGNGMHLVGTLAGHTAEVVKVSF